MNDPSQTGIRAYTKGELRVITGTKNRVKKIKRGLGITGAKNQDVWIIKGKEAQKINVTIGTANGEYVEIISNIINIGDEVIISDMKAYQHKTKIVINE